MALKLDEKTELTVSLKTLAVVIAPVKNVVDKIIPTVPKHMPKPSNPFAKKKKKK